MAIRRSKSTAERRTLQVLRPAGFLFRRRISVTRNRASNYRSRVYHSIQVAQRPARPTFRNTFVSSILTRGQRPYRPYAPADDIHNNGHTRRASDTRVRLPFDRRRLAFSVLSFLTIDVLTELGEP